MAGNKRARANDLLQRITVTKEKAETQKNNFGRDNGEREW